jgi:hypothetical protein
MTRRNRRRRRRCHRLKAEAKPEVAASGTPPREKQPEFFARIARALREGLGFPIFLILYWVSDRRRRLTKRPAQYWFALITLLVATIGIFGTWYAALRSVPSVAKVDFDTGVIEGSGPGAARSFATPKLHAVLHIRLTLTPTHQDLDRVAVAITPPPSIELTSRCFYEVSGSGRQSCLEPDGEGRIDIDHLAEGESLHITAKIVVIHRIEGREAIAIDMSSSNADEPSKRQIDLYSPTGTHGEEAAKKDFHEEVSGGPLNWDESSMQMREDVFEDLGNEWQFLNPWRLHSLGQVPYGRMLDVRSLINNRLLAAKIVTLRSVVRSSPVRVRSFRAEGSGVRAIKEVFAIGPKPGEHDLWCATSRSTAQPPLHRGDPVLLRAALVGWGQARPYGQPVQAALMICPTVQLLDPSGEPPSVSTAGGTPAPGR